VFAALVRYMRSGGVPYKHRVIGLLTRLLQHPRCFAPADPPPLQLPMATQTAWAGEVFRTTVESLLLLLAMVMLTMMWAVGKSWWYAAAQERWHTQIRTLQISTLLRW
jgi:hypothetical protein